MAANTNYEASDYRHRDRVLVRRALISVSDKTGLIELAKALNDSGVSLVSTGSTAKTIAEAGIVVTEVSQVTGFQEALDGRVKTLHPKIHGGLLADMRLANHEQQLHELDIEPFELVVVNLYPFVKTVESGAKGDAVIDQIDIGGPAMVRAAAKNHANVAIVVDPSRYADIIKAVGEGGTTLNQRRDLAAEAFAHTAKYDTAVAAWFAAEAQARNLPGNNAETAHKNPGFAKSLEISAELQHVLRYGENGHQAAAIYRSTAAGAVSGIAQARMHGGKEMSYNNYVDADAAVRAAYDFSEPAVAIIKHANPCGIAIAGADQADPISYAHAQAFLCDRESAFGGVVAANRKVTMPMAQAIMDVFTEVLIAPSYDLEALRLLTTNRKNLRILELPVNYSREALELRQISGGFLLQETDDFTNFTSRGWKQVSGTRPDDATMADLEFAWRAIRSVKSNGILLAHDLASVGVGMGQVNRVDSCRLAVTRADFRAKGSVAASDAFFPFADGLQVLIDAGVKAIVQPGGSVRDEEVIAAAKEAGVAMFFTGERHFYH